MQVTTSLKESNKNREVEGLIEVLNEYKLEEGLIITEDQGEEIVADNKKITVVPIWKWLLENE